MDNTSCLYTTITECCKERKREKGHPFLIPAFLAGVESRLVGFKIIVMRTIFIS